MNPISSASSGLISASANFSAASGSVVSAVNGGNGDLTAAIVSQSQAAVQLQAAANVEKVSNAMTSVLLDITV
jgi:hypothetical protein